MADAVISESANLRVLAGAIHYQDQDILRSSNELQKQQLLAIK